LLLSHLAVNEPEALVTPPAPSTTDTSRWIALVVLCAGMLMIILDQTIVNVALPSIQRDLGFDQSSLAWVVNAYLIAFGGLLLLAGRLGDLIGRKTIFLAGIAVFTLASALCGVAQSQALLVVARFIQGAGGALTSSVILGMIITMFPERGEQAKAIGVFSFVASAGASAGLLAGGVLTQALSWHWIFFVNLPIGVLTAVLGRRFVVADTGLGLRQGADVPGATLITAALMLAVYTIVKTSDYGWGSAHTLGLGTLAIALGVGFVVREHRAATPLIPLGIFRSRAITGANLVQMLMVSGMFGMFFLGAVYLQRVLGYGPLDVGLAFLPVAISIGALSIGVTPRLNMRFGAKQTLIPGLALTTAGLALFALAPEHAAYLSDILAPMILIGLGAGLVFPSVMTIAMTGVPMSQSGLASGLVNTSMQVGGALGLSVLATLSSTRTHDLLAAGSSPAHALTGGFHLSLVIGAGLLIASLTLATVLLRSGSEHAHEPVLEPETADGLAYSEVF
jgi:EmrB/QacA subfamily drug resistance transporter